MIAQSPREVILAESEHPAAPSPPDNALRRLLTWVAIALIVAVILAVIGVELVFWLFDR